MVTWRMIGSGLLLWACVATVGIPSASAQQNGPPPKSANTASDADEAAKREILQSQRWRRAIFEMSQWLSRQQIYNKKQVEEIKQGLNVRVAKMSAAELQAMLDDMDSKFQIMESEQARDAGSWMAQYLSYLSDKRRAEMLKDVPNVLTMTADQLSQEIAKIEQKRATMERNQAIFNQTQQSQANAIMEARQASARASASMASLPPASFSPYRNGSSDKKPFADAHRPSDPVSGFYIGVGGGLGMSIAPSSW
jgi:LPS O-antigen subunit length determinant protein (WzzB/FepE family)